MKKMFTFFVIIGLMITISSSYAQSTDTLVVTASVNGAPNFINEVIDNNPNIKAFKLVTRDTCYLFSDMVTRSDDFTIIGELDPVTKRPPTIQPFELSDGSVPGKLFNFNGEGSKILIKNLYLLSKSNNNTQNLPDAIAIQVTADNITLTVTNCVFDSWAQFAIGYNGNWDKFFISDCTFRNMVHPEQWYVGEVIRNMWPGTSYTDTLSMVNNTIFCVNGYAAAPVTKYYMKYFEFKHNTVVYTFKNPFFIFNVTDAKINDNIFYGNWAGGSSKTEMPWWDQLWSPEIGSIIDLDTLDTAKDSVFAPDLVGDPDMRMKAEKRRKVEVYNNAYYWSDKIKDMWTNWNATASSDDSLFTHTWMNTRTTNMFTDKNTWPNLNEANNVEESPNFDAFVDDIVTQTENGLEDWFKLCRSGNLSTTVWGYGIVEPTGDPTWVPTWPLPENLAYTSSTLKSAASDGFAVGDLNWFPEQKQQWIATDVAEEESIPTDYNLSQNYPNPFNPSTTIKFSVPNREKVELAIYDLLGKKVSTLLNGEVNAGSHKVSFDATNLSSGIYFYRLSTSKGIITKKMTLLK